MTTAGQLRERVTFAKRTIVDDGYGNTAGPFADQFTVWARMQFLRGGEEIMASRLGGKQPVVITVRHSPDAEQIATDWHVRNAATGEVYNVRSVTPDERRAFIDILCERGVAT